MNISFANFKFGNIVIQSEFVDSESIEWQQFLEGFLLALCLPQKKVGRIIAPSRQSCNPWIIITNSFQHLEIIF